MRHALVAAAALAAAAWMLGHAPAGDAQGVQVPIFEYDPTFPKPLPENWAIGAIGGLAVDRQDHVYVLQRPRTLANNERFTGAGDTPPKADCCIPAPPVLEFDQSGTLVRSWGGPGVGYDRDSAALPRQPGDRAPRPGHGFRHRSAGSVGVPLRTGEPVGDLQLRIAEG